MQISCSNKAYIIFIYNKWTLIATMNIPNNLDVYFQNSTQECPVHCLIRGSRRIPNSYLVYCLKTDVLLFHMQLIGRRSKKSFYMAEIQHMLTKWPPLLLALLIKLHFCSYLSICQWISCNYYDLSLWTNYMLVK